METSPELSVSDAPADAPVSHPPTKISQIWLFLSLVIVGFLVGIGSGYLIWGLSLDQRVQTGVTAALKSTQEANRPEPPTELKRYDVPVDDDYILGPEDAPITIIEFSDYQCPYCKKWYDEVLLPLFEAYPGKIRFVYRDFPLTSSHPQAVAAAEAANCAGEQGKYYDYHNSLFSNKYQLSASGYAQYASELGLDIEKFDECVRSQRSRVEIMADLEWASTLGVSSTPTFFLNGIPLVGAQPLETFQMVIDWELEGKLPKD